MGELSLLLHLFLGRRSIRLEDIGLCSEAAYECREMLEISELPQVYRFVALEHIVFGEKERAALIAREGVEIDPEDAERHRMLGDVYFELERYADAAGAYQRAVEHGCGDAGVLLPLGRCHELLGDHKSAAEWQGRAVAVSPGSQHTY